MKNEEIKNNSLYTNVFEKDNCGMGFICNIDGERTNDTVKDGIKILLGLEHRGAKGADPKTGDGAGLLFQIPHEFFKSVINNLPEIGDYGVGTLFLPINKEENEKIREIIKSTVNELGEEFLELREVPINDTVIGETAKTTIPNFVQLFIKRISSKEEFNRSLYFIRKNIEKKVRALNLKEFDKFYITSLSNHSILYKGLLTPEQIDEFYLDLKSDKVKSSYCLVHQRFSTNTFPQWKLSHPFRYLAHNGEINTIKGNINWMKARENQLKSDVYKDRIKELFPITDSDYSDSSNLDEALEFLVNSGLSLLESISILVPAAWEKDNFMSDDLKNFYNYYSGIMEPWDGPAGMIMTDGRYLIAKLDRNGLRPLRYIVTKDNKIIVGSEVGMIPISFDNIKESGRVSPGKTLLVDIEENKIYKHDEVVEKIVSDANYKDLNSSKKYIKDKNIEIEDSFVDFDKTYNDLLLYNYSREDLELLILNMAKNGKEPVGSMGNDVALSIFNNEPTLLYNYFKQLFAQVTNPPIDPIREDIVMSLTTQINKHGDLFQKTNENSNTLVFDNPIITNETLEYIIKEYSKSNNYNSKKYMLSFKENLDKTLDDLYLKIENDIKSENIKMVILTDKYIYGEYPIPALLASSGLHHYLIKKGLRGSVDIVVETGEAREPMHFALLIGYGVDLINPYLVFESIQYMINKNDLETPYKDAVKNYTKAIASSLLKTISKMGISTIQSYRGAQIFEILGFSNELVEKYFTGSVSRIGGIDITFIENDVKNRKINAKEYSSRNTHVLPNYGEYSWRKEGVKRTLTPLAIEKLQHSTKLNDYNIFKEYSKEINDQSKNLKTIRGLLKFKNTNPIDISKVEPIENIMKKFVTGAMSLGSLSKEAHEALALAMNQIGGKSNSGEGGEEIPRLYSNKRSATKQIASGRFGVTTSYLVNADELQIKMAQGAKPGEGGQLPGHKVDEYIGSVRHTTPGIDLISPPPHHDIYSIEDLAQLIYDLKNVNEKARISVKLVSEAGVGTIASGVSKAHAEMILISGHDGGTGASPLSSIKHAGLPWELGLAESHQILVEHKLRGRTVLQVDGQLKTGRDVVIGALLGAEEYGFATIPLVSLGCIMMRKCHSNTCPVGIATQSEELRKRFNGEVEYVVNYFKFVATEIREILAELGFEKLDDLVGRVDLLEVDESLLNNKTKNINLEKILYKPKAEKGVNIKCLEKQDHDMKNILDRTLINDFDSANSDIFEKSYNINNSNRSVGTMLSGYIIEKYKEEGLGKKQIKLTFNGYAGQSFGAFGTSNIELKVNGMTNDYLGKGLSGSRIIVKNTINENSNSIISGNAILYGATSGEVYINGTVGERFCVRNSGALAVVEGTGDHGCEYMTGGRVVVLGEIGKNFGAGMSGGIAYIYDKENKFEKNFNLEIVQFEDVNNEYYKNEIKDLISKHYNYTNSIIAKNIIDNYENEYKNFKVIISPQYKKLVFQDVK